MSIPVMHQRISNFSDKLTGTGASPDDIAEVEKQLGVRLPASYRDFLGTYGWARFAFNEFYGIGADVPPHLQLSTNTIAERTAMQPPMPHSLIPVLNDGAGNHYCLATNQISDGECPVVFWDHDNGPDQETTKEGRSFGEWLIKFLDEA
jgi:cell wall assembly regulator SMI1